ncbi:RNA polymerase sigma factor [Halalkalibaculum sp. DA384]|uniref:RNA polymerase sigma factor n=1 Tax=Halalkalibaculum sp. DA384 TaxID=3373606 RepID=UPI003754A7C4
MHKQKGIEQNISKEKVWERFAEGEERLFKNLFEAYYQELFGYGIKLCHRPEIVKDCIQELFKTLWERRDELDHIGSPNVYLFVSLRRNILRQIKKGKKSEGDLGEMDEGSFIRFSREDVIITDEIKHKNKNALKKALNQLSDRQKEVIYLHFYSGMSYGEIEQILSINRQSVRNHIYRAMETLRTLLDNEIMKLVITLMVTVLPMARYFG